MTNKSLRVALGAAFVSFILIILFRSMIHFNVAMAYSSLVFAITLYGCFFIGLSIFTKRVQFLNPLVLMPFLFMMYALGPLGNEAKYSHHTVLMYLWYQFIGISSLWVGLLAIGNHRTPKRQVLDNDFSYRLTYTAMFLLGGASAYTEIAAFGGLGAIVRLGYGTERYEIFEQSSVFGGSFQWILLASIILFVFSLKKRQLFGMIISALSGLFTTYLLLLIGGRSTIVYSAIFFFVLLVGTHRFKSSLLLNVILMIGMVFSQIFSYARAYMSQGLMHAFQEVIDIIMRAPQLFIPLPKKINEFVIPATSLLDVLENLPDTRFFGATYIPIVNNIIPGISRFIGGFGINPSDWYLQIFHPDVFLASGGKGFSPVTEGYLNFGIFGIVIQLFLYGLFAGWLYQWMMNRQDYLSKLLYAGALPIFILDGMRIYSASATYKLLRIYLLPFFLYYVFSYVTLRRFSGTNRTVARLNHEDNV